MTDRTLLDDQITYYRARAAEYDAEATTAVAARRRSRRRAGRTPRAQRRPRPGGAGE